MEKGLVFKKSQISIFVILALVIVVGLLVFFAYKSHLFPSVVPSEISPAYDYYTSCVQSILRDGVRIAGSRAGYLQSPDFNPGTTFAPFSSELNFLGQAVPYWYYISGNGLSLEQIPTKKQIEQQFDSYLQAQIEKCGLDSFISSGYSVTLGPAVFKTIIDANKVSSRVSQKINIGYAGKTFSINGFDVSLDSSFGNFYDIAKRIYDYEKKNSFLENYSVDVLYSYAPVSGVVLNCSPTIWSPYDVVNKLKNALNANIGMLKINGDYYTNANSYFVVGKNNEFNLKNEQVSFMYSSSWPSRFEVWPTKNNLMIASPIGTQQGLSSLGFCYAPYKFVYDMYFPVLIQIYNPSDANEVFQFPFAVVVSKNVPREAQAGEYIGSTRESICDKANAEIKINTYNVNLEPVENAEVSFKCLTDSCGLGKTKINNASGEASLNALVPQCVNGIISVNLEGYKEKKYLISTNRETNADIVLDREYKIPLEIYVDNVLSNENSVLIISEKLGESSDFADSVSYPFIKEIILGEGDYEFELDVYKASNLVIPGTTTRQCINQPKAGILGLMFGLEEEKCYDLNIPGQTLVNIPYAGGKISQYIAESELENAKIFKIYATSVKLPSSAEEIQASYDSLEAKKLSIDIV